MNGHLYDPKLHRFLQPDNFVQDPYNTQNYNRYGYVFNNPLMYTDPSGEWIWILVGAVVGGVINWVAHGATFDARGLAAFGIGAAAGALAGIIGPAAFTAAGVGAAGAGGFLAGAVGGAAGAFVSQTVLSVGNHVAFGDPLMTPKQVIVGIAVGAVLGGAINGSIAKLNGKSFVDGVTPRVEASVVSKLTPAGLVENTKNGMPTTDTKLPSATQTSTKPTTQAQTASALPKDGGRVDVSKTEFGRVVDDGLDANRLNHVFGKSEHNLQSLASKFGSQENAYYAVQKAANEALKSGSLTPNLKGILPNGDFGNIINVGGMNVRLIGGRVFNGQVILSSFSRKGL